MYHNPPKFLDEGVNSTAYYSKADPEFLVIFVHGFTGKAVSTWNDFSGIAQREPAFEKCDLLFYGYNSWRGQAYDQAQDFYSFLNKYATRTKVSLRRNEFSYKGIIIVAHSLGAIVSRYAILSAIDQNDIWRNKCRLVLMAPAHHGARIQNLLMLSLPSFTKLAGGLGLFMYPVIDDLKPGSVSLNQLKARTDAFKNSTEMQILKALVIEAKGDRIVHNNKFCFDSYLPSNQIIGKSHSNMCKPNENNYLIPIDELSNLILSWRI